jgi:hypothetical protein
VMPYGLPNGFHGCFLPAKQAAGGAAGGGV